MCLTEKLYWLSVDIVHWVIRTVRGEHTVSSSNTRIVYSIMRYSMDTSVAVTRVQKQEKNEQKEKIETIHHPEQRRASDEMGYSRLWFAVSNACTLWCNYMIFFTN